MANLDVARTLARRVMLDTGRLTRDSEGNRDDVLDAATLQLVRPVGEPSTIYEGECHVGDDRQGDRSAPGYAPTVGHRYRVRLPFDAPEPKVGDTFEVLSSAHDPGLVGKRMKVLDVRLSTHLVTRQIVCELAMGERP